MLDIVIIGGGAAGLFLSANLRTNNAVLLNHAEEVGKKILITGGGMCNLTNTLPPDQFLMHFGDKGQRNFLLPALQAFPPDNLQQWFIQHGVSLTTREDGKVFPASLDAHQVRDILVHHSRARIFNKVEILDIKREQNSYVITTNTTEFRTKVLVLATGGMSYPRTGSDGSGYQLAKLLGHSIVPPKPALSAVSIDSYPWTRLAGNSLRAVSAEFAHAGEQKRFLQATGDILFTHDGLSGPLILTASRILKAGDTITLSLIPYQNKNETMQMLTTLFANNPKKKITTLLKEAGIFASLAQYLVDSNTIPIDLTAANLNKQMRQQLVNAIVQTRFTIKAVKGFNSAMVTAGGVSLDEVNRKTMESKIHKELYFCGEILDYDGESGGYNLQAAFSTAHLIASNV